MRKEKNTDREQKDRDEPTRDALVEDIHYLVEIAVNMKVDVPAFPSAFDTKEIVDVSGDHVEAREEHDRDEHGLGGFLIQEASSERYEEKSDTGPDEQCDSCDCEVCQFTDNRRNHPKYEVICESDLALTQLCGYDRILLSGEIEDDRPLVINEVI